MAVVTPGTYKVDMTCNIAPLPTKTFWVMVTVLDPGCFTGNTMVEPTPTLPQLNIGQLTPPSFIAAFKDSFSGTSNPPTCGPRTCSSGNNPNVIWNNVS